MLGALLEEALLVRCIVCHGEGTVEPPTSGQAWADRDVWPDLSCIFTPGCQGRVHPEPIN